MALGSWVKDEPAWRGADQRESLAVALGPVAVLVAGYGWLGSVVDGAFGAAVGCATGLILRALLYLLAGSAVSGVPVRGGHRD